MKYLDPYSSIGDTLSSINFNFTCLDIKVSNLQTLSENYNQIEAKSNWLNGYDEALAMSANWETTKQQVHNASAFWDQRVNTIMYPNPFPEGRETATILQNWINSTFPARNYRDGQKFIIYFFEWYKDPLLHDPPTQSVSKFGQISEENTVKVKRVGWHSFEKFGKSWVLSNLLHWPKDCLPEDCSSCWGIKSLPDHPLCIPQPIYYKLSCSGVEEEEETVDLSGCDVDVDVVWYFPSDESGLEQNTIFRKLSSTDLVPYSIGFSYNPTLDYINSNVYQKYIWESPQPTLFNGGVQRLSAFYLQHTYEYVASADMFSNETIFSADSSYDFSLSASIDFPYRFNNSILKLYLNANNIGNAMSSSVSSCPFVIQIDSVWYRWVTGNLSVSSTPYWHIGVEPGSSLGFYFEPESSTVDPASAWLSAHSVMGDSLSAYFGTYNDMMGKINDIRLFALSS